MREKGRSESEITFKTRPDLYRALVGDLDDIIAGFNACGPTEKELEEARTWLIKNNLESKAKRSESMSHRNSQVMNYIRNGIDPNTDWEAAYKKVSAEDVRKAAGKLTGRNALTVIYTEE